MVFIPSMIGICVRSFTYPVYFKQYITRCFINITRKNGEKFILPCKNRNCLWIMMQIIISLSAIYTKKNVKLIYFKNRNSYLFSFSPVFIHPRIINISI